MFRLKARIKTLEQEVLSKNDHNLEKQHEEDLAKKQNFISILEKFIE